MEHAVKLYRELKTVLKMRASDTQEKEEETLNKLKHDISGNGSSSNNAEKCDLPICDSVAATETEVNSVPSTSFSSHASPVVTHPLETDGLLNSFDKQSLNQNISDHYNLPTSSLLFSANVAAMAVAKSQSLGLKTLVGEEFLGDNDDDDASDCIFE